MKIGIFGLVRRESETDVSERHLGIAERRGSVSGDEGLQSVGRVLQPTHDFGSVLVRDLDGRDERQLCLLVERACPAVAAREIVLVPVVAPEVVPDVVPDELPLSPPPPQPANPTAEAKAKASQPPL